MKDVYKSTYKNANGHERIKLHVSMKKTLWDEMNLFCQKNDVRRVDFVESAIRNKLKNGRA